jgi:hypothetical protein
MLKYVTKFVSDILPSVIATIIGAYIVNHYIVTKPAAPIAAAVETKKVDDGANKAAKGDIKIGDAPADTASIPEPAKAKSSPEKSVADKAADKPSARHQPAPRDKDKAVAKAVAPATPAAVTTVAAAPSAAPVETVTPQEERRDANDLARAAIERLRNSNEAARSADAAAKVQETAKPQETLRVAAPIQPLPPAVTIAVPTTASIEPFSPAPTAAALPSSNPFYSANARNDDPHRMSPPADIPSHPIDLHADAGPPSRPTVAEDVLSAAKSVFHAVLPR